MLDPSEIERNTEKARREAAIHILMANMIDPPYSEAEIGQVLAVGDAWTELSIMGDQPHFIKMIKEAIERIRSARKEI